MVRTNGPILQNGDIAGTAGEALDAYDHVSYEAVTGDIVKATAGSVAIGYVDKAYADGEEEVSVLRFQDRKRPAVAGATNVGVIAIGAPVAVDADGKARVGVVGTDYLVGVAATASAAEGDELEVEAL